MHASNNDITGADASVIDERTRMQKRELKTHDIGNLT